MRSIFLLIFFAILSTACSAKINKNLKYNGDVINSNFEKTQEFITNYEVEDGGPILENKIKIYSIDDNKNCVIVSKIDGDSGVYGTEAIIYFSKSQVLYGYRLNYSYSFSDGEGSEKLDKLNYLYPEKNIGKNELEKEFNLYAIFFNKRTLRFCD